MQSLALLSLLASAAFALDPKSGTNPTYGFDTVQHPAQDEVVKAGSTFTIQWETPSKYDGEKVTINLLGGSSPNTQSKLAEVASGIDNSDGSFSWTVKSSLGKDKVYGLQLISEKDNSLWQYSDHFTISQSSGGSGGDGDDDSKSTATGDNNTSSATETDKETGSKSTSTATETGDDNESTATETETSAPKTTSTGSASETSPAATETTLTTAPSKSTDASATDTEAPSSTTSEASQTNAAGVLGSSNMLALGGVAAALFAL